MDGSRLKKTEDDVSVLAVGICMTPHGNTHTGIVHRDLANEARFFEQAFHKLTRNELVSEAVQYCHQRFLFAVPDLVYERAECIAGLCRLISSTGPSFAYALKHDPLARFDERTGQLTLSDGRGLNCSTFVLVVFRTARAPLIDFEGWPERDGDKEDQAKLVGWLRSMQPPSEQEHIDAVEKEIGCIRARPEEVAGACLVDMPAHFAEASDAGSWVRTELDAVPFVK
jgi:hypothetical protein